MGEVVWLGRYPVKSMLGEELTDVELGESGIAGDRRHALIDERTALVASAKNPRKWRGLLKIKAGYDHGGRLVLTLPDGTVVPGDHQARDELLSRALGRPVRLAGTRPDGARLERLTPEVEAGAGELTRGALAAVTPGDTFVDFAAVHLVTTATLDALAADRRRFRPNIVVRMVDPVPFAENQWPGRTLRVGGLAELRVIVPTPRCVVPTLAQGRDLPHDPDVLRTAARLNRVPVLNLGVLTCVGAYAAVRRGGRLRVGDRVLVA